MTNRSKLDGRRRIEFFDTPDQTLLVRGLILRRREDDERVDLTLKARSEDRCLAAAAEVQADKDLPDKRVKQKFEEDIAAPFRPRFSNSCTVKFSAGDAPPAPASLADAAAWFPDLRKLNRDGLRCAAETPLAVVHGVEV